MTDPDTIAAFNEIRRTIASDEPTPLEDAVLRHIEEAPALPPTPDDLSLPPTDDQVFNGVPDAPLADVPTQPMRLPHDTVPNPFEDENWEEEKTAVREVPQFRKPHDPTGCMM